jgi:hypothetical protein
VLTRTTCGQVRFRCVAEERTAAQARAEPLETKVAALQARVAQLESEALNGAGAEAREKMLQLASTVASACHRDALEGRGMDDAAAAAAPDSRRRSREAEPVPQASDGKPPSEAGSESSRPVGRDKKAMAARAAMTCRGFSQSMSVRGGAGRLDLFLEGRNGGKARKSAGRTGGAVGISNGR